MCAHLSFQAGKKHSGSEVNNWSEMMEVASTWHRKERPVYMNGAGSVLTF